jgi:hypothetical protein
MKKLTVLAIVFLLLPVFSAGAEGTTHRKHVAPAPKARASTPAPSPTPPVTRLPIAPDTFRA